MGVCLPKSNSNEKTPSTPELNGSTPTSVPAQDQSMEASAPLSPKSSAPRGGGGMAVDDVRSPAPGEAPLRGDWQAPQPAPVRRKQSLQMDAADMQAMLTQVAPGSPMSPKRSPEHSSPMAPHSGPDLLPPPGAADRGKRCLAIDLDETLVHTERQPSGFAGGKYDFKISVKVGCSTFPMYVAKRPGCDEFLRKASENYELVIFTASVEAYCSAVMEKIDPHHYVSHCLNRTHCTFHMNEIYVKDLSRLGRSLPDTILLDNNADCYLFQPQNAIPINSWYDDKTDTDLEDVMGILDVVSQSKKSAVATLKEIDEKLGWERAG